MLRKLAVADFRPFAGRHEVSLAPVTLVYGPNSAGKTSLLQAPLLMSQLLVPRSVEERHLASRINGPLVNLGHWSDLPYRSPSGELPTRPITLEVTIPWPQRWPSFRFLPPLLFSDFFSSEREIELTVTGTWELKYINDDPECIPVLETFLTNLSYRFDVEGEAPLTLRFENDLAGWRLVDDGEQLHRFLVFLSTTWNPPTGSRLTNETCDPVLEAEIEQLFADVRSRDPRTFLEDLAPELERQPRGGLPTIVDSRFGTRALRALFDDLAAQAWNALSRVGHLGPQHSTLPRTTPLAGADAIPSPLPALTGNDALEILLYPTLRSNRQFHEWLHRLGFGYYLSVLPLPETSPGQTYDPRVSPLAYRCTFDDQERKISVFPDAAGCGINRVVPLVGHAVLPGATTLVVEHPEAHLYPAVQERLADLFVETGVQWLVETHSERLLRRMREIVRSGQVGPESIRVLYVDPTPEGSRVLHLRLDASGRFLDELPPDFPAEP